jgi:DNA processing protein
MRHLKTKKQKHKVKLVPPWLGIVSEVRIAELRGSVYEHFFNDLVSSPTTLWYIGSCFEDLLTYDRVAVVGSRDVTEAGKSAAFELGATLAKNGSVVISGLALGIDTAVFEGAISEGGRCIAILPSGFNQIVPRSNNGLAEQILQNGGGLLSEYPRNIGPRKYRYLQRNRLIAAFSTKLILGESKENGGARNALQHAWDLNRPTFKLENDGDLTEIFNPQRRL